jgi:pyrophosphatase PpaX
MNHSPAEGPAGAGSWDAVLFDLDGTLADTVELILRSYRYTMEEHLGTAPPDSRWLATIGRPLRDSLQAFARTPDEAAAMMETYVGFQREHHDGLVAPYAGVVGMLDTLRRRGVAMGVVTSKRREMALRTLRRCGVLEHFQVVVTADEVVYGKPHPEPVLRALDLLGLPGPANSDRGPGPRVVFVGDSPFDIRAGRGAGVSTAAALWGPFSRDALEAELPHHWLERPEQVLGLPAGWA